MSYENNSLTTIGNVKSLAAKTKLRFDELDLEQATLNSRMDAQVTASTTSYADYAAEVIDARVDTWANEQGSLGTNIRGGQSRLSDALELLQTSHQEQINLLAEARLENLVNESESNKVRRREISLEEESRIESDDVLQTQIESLSSAIFEVLLQIAKIRKKLRENQEDL